MLAGAMAVWICSVLALAASARLTAEKEKTRINVNRIIRFILSSQVLRVNKNQRVAPFSEL
jgi:hypothetical protein